jgi:hypothetical protein
VIVAPLEELRAPQTLAEEEEAREREEEVLGLSEGWDYRISAAPSGGSVTEGKGNEGAVGVGVGAALGAGHRVLPVDPCMKRVRMRSYGIF